jgi:trans-aconitate methyltransferase
VTIVDRAASLARRLVPDRVWSAIAGPYRDWRFARASRRGWLTRQDKVDGHVAVYWSSLEHPNRRQLIDTIARYVGEPPFDILEFGCHAGMNFRLLADRFPALRYHGVEPNHDAARFLREKLPFVRLLEAEDREFVDGRFVEHAHISFVNVVLYAIQGKRARRIVDKLCKISDVLIIGEQLANRGDRTTFQQGPEMYVHPYASWIRAAGFHEIEVVPAPEPSAQLSGFLVARRRR